MHNSYITLKEQDWAEVLENVKELPKKEIYMFILRSMANSQQISYYSIAAFNEELIDDQDHAGQSNNTYISQITRIVNSVVQEQLESSSAWYLWHTTDKAWVLGWESFNNLRKAFKSK